jgi:hypothetical protein
MEALIKASPSISPFLSIPSINVYTFVMSVMLELDGILFYMHTKENNSTMYKKCLQKVYE